MSVPARELVEPRPPARVPESQPESAARPARQPAARPNTATPPQRRARRGPTPAFWFLSAAIVSVLVWAIVALGALVVNTTYRMTDVQGQVRGLQDQHAQLDLEVARLSSPMRIAVWAEMVGLVVPAPGDSIILRVPGDRGRDRGPGEGAA